MPAESRSHHIGAYLTRGIHLPTHLLNILEPYLPSRIELPRDELIKRITNRVALHKERNEITALKSGLFEYRTSARPLVVALTDFKRDHRLYHFSHSYEGKYPDNRVPLELGEGITIIDGRIRIAMVPPQGGLPLAYEVPDGIIHANFPIHMRIIALGTLHDLGIR